MIVTIRPEAESDLLDAAQWYEQCRDGLGAAFLDEVLSTIHHIAEHPLLYARVHEDIRRVMIRRFPFGVFYLLEADRVIVFAVMHASRDPARWKERT